MTEPAIQERHQDPSNKKAQRYYPLNDSAKIDAVVVHCSDPRFQEAFRRFIKEELKMEHPAPLVVPGSISSVGLELAMPKHLKTLKDQVAFMLKHGERPRLVLINHEDCRAYAAFHGKLMHLLLNRQLADLRKAAQIFQKIVPTLSNLPISVYMARLDDKKPPEERVYFEKIV
ncbi:MAG: hypothetical protein HYW89_01775 [Candidatus Sungiibacteriota bacterium]|uniref:Carbonic anhydrase n=1 Tax=Candidatus Sungiibacteriota bacterium TaxID=2750080 RepID=A0A7T5RK74_9BACT|nr:MAG: hypothetical protein HYW89_01775 [Candidatus Sungbacteria bacterium]